MRKFRKIVAIEPTRFPPAWDDKLRAYAEEAVLYQDIPRDNEAIIHRIGDADCVLLSHTSRIDRDVIASCPEIRYVGMCCSLYSPESANVDILYARENGIAVTGVRDYGDEGVREYVISALVQLLQGRGEAMWKDEPVELTNLRIGIIGMGTVGSMVAHTLHFFGASLQYYSRTRKPEIEQDCRCLFLPLDALLTQVDILITCLNKNVVLLGEREFSLFGTGKILMNLSISPSHEIPALLQWLSKDGNYALSDTVAGLGEEAAAEVNAFCGTHSAGMTSLAKRRLAEKAIANIEAYLSGNHLRPSEHE